MRHPRALTLAVAPLLLLCPSALAATYHVAPDGDDMGSGDEADPWFSIGRAQESVEPGDTVIIHGGVYLFSGTTDTVGGSFTTSGTPAQPIRYLAARGEPTPVFDLTNLNPEARVTGLDVNCDWVHIRGPLEVTGVHQFEGGQDSWGVRIRGDGNVIENLDVHHNDAPGIFITSGADNLILDCDSHHNYDFLEDGGSADGFGCHSSGDGNLISGCRAYDNSDDGYDFINAPGSCTVEGSFAFRNGFVPDTMTPAGNGAGFKAGGYGSPPNVPGSGAAIHTVRQCVSFGNRAQGFYANHHPGRIFFYNNTAFGNPVNYNMLADEGFASDHVLRNNIAMAPGTDISNLSGGSDTDNSWTLPVTVDADDFMSVDPAQAETPRAADGSLPALEFMHLVEASDLVDAGVDVMLPFVGDAPDLGAFEYGAEPPGGDSSGDGGSTADGSGGADSGASGNATLDGTVASADSAPGGDASGGTGTSGGSSDRDGGGCACASERGRGPVSAWLLLSGLGMSCGWRRRKRLGPV